MKKSKKIKALYSSCAIDPESGRRILTRQVVEAELKREKPTAWTYIGLVIGIGIAIALGYFLFWMFYLFVVNCLIGIKDAVVTNRKLKNWQQNYVLERPCIEKRRIPRDDDPDLLQLWFSKDEQWNVAIGVEEDDYDATQEGDLFYIVCVPGDKHPWLWYRTSEWKLDTKSWEQFLA